MTTSIKQCWLPYYHADIGFSRDAAGTWYQPCCKYDEPWLTNIDEYYSKDRQEFEQDALPPACNACTQVKHSYRDVRMTEFRKIWSEPVKPSLRSLHLILDNTCSNSCLMCNESYSTTIGMLRKNYIKIYNDFSKLDYSELEFLTISGGEPLQSKNLILLCEKLKESHLKSLNVITSLANVKEKNITALESLQKPLTFRVSIDGPWDLHSWIRDMKHQDWIANLNRVRHHSINWQITVGSYNIFALPETLEYIETLVPGANVQPSIVTGPKPAFAVSSMPADLRLKIKAKLLNYTARPNGLYIIATAIELLEQESDLDWPTCIGTIEELPKLRKDNRSLVDFINQYLP